MQTARGGDGERDSCRPNVGNPELHMNVTSYVKRFFSCGIRVWFGISDGIQSVNSRRIEFIASWQDTAAERRT